jgi:ribosomal protein S27E
MLPKSVSCEICGQTAAARGYGRVVYDGGSPGQVVVEPKIHAVHLTIDCPHCGVLVQVHYPQVPSELTHASR